MFESLELRLGTQAVSACDRPLPIKTLSDVMVKHLAVNRKFTGSIPVRRTPIIIKTVRFFGISDDF